MFRKMLKALPLFLLLCAPSLGLEIFSPVIRDHADLDNLLTDAEIKTQNEANPDTNAFTDNEQLKLSELSNEIGGGHNSSIWQSDTGGTTPPPSTERMRWNNATQSSATELFVDDTNANSIDVSAFLSAVPNGSLIRIQLASDASVFQVFEVTSTTDNTTFFTFGVTNDSANGGNIANNRDIVLTFITSNDIAKHASTHQTSGDDSIPLVTVGVDGLMSATDKTKIDGIETAATADQTDGEIKTAYEANANTNEFDDAEQTKLGTVESNAKDDQSAAEVSFSPTGGIAATDTQAAVAEVDSEAEKTANKNAVSGYAGLDGSSKLTGSQQVYGTGANTAVEGNDARVPTTGENDALVGSSGTPSTSNPYVTDEDNRLDIHWGLKTVSEGGFEVFSGTPDIVAPNWDSVDLMAYILVTGNATDDQGGIVYEFVIPEGVTDLTEVSCTGKLGTVSQDAITVRVKRDDGTQVDTGGPHQITAATETLLVITTFSGETFVPGTRFIIEVEYQGDNTETASIGSCLVEMAR